MIESTKISPYVQVVQRGDKIIYINPNIPRWAVTNSLGALILSLFDGTRSIEDIINLALEAFGSEKENEIRYFCTSILNSGLLENVAPQPKKHRMLLSSVHLSLSDSCNLSCKYCYAKARIETGYPRLTLDEYHKIIDDILEINPGVTFTLTGGEPLLNKNCFNIAEYIKSKGGRVFLLSNGTLFTDKNINIIARLFDLVTVSIDGPNSKVHSYTRGDNFELVERAIKLMHDKNINFTLSMTVTKQNIQYIEEMAKKYGNSLNFAPYFPVLNETSELAISGIEYFKALKSAAGVNPLSYCESSLEGSMSNPCHKCAIGDGEFSISATGDVYPCQLLHSDEFLAGNTHEKSIKDIYLNSTAIYNCSRLDVDNILGCKDCAIKYICGGSCRARAFYESGDLKSSSEFCEYEKEAFYDGIVSIYSKNLLGHD